MNDGNEQYAVRLDQIHDAIVGIEQLAQRRIPGLGNYPADLRETGQVLDCAENSVNKAVGVVLRVSPDVVPDALKVPQRRLGLLDGHYARRRFFASS
jgi:hypothetical protein